VLTRLTVRNFKRFDRIEIELGEAVILIGPNNSGKTSALQTLALWELGVRRWTEKRGTKGVPDKRPGVVINRRDLISTPVPASDLLWRDLHVRDVHQVEGKPQTQNIRIDIVVDGVTEDKAWTCGLEFDYANEESFYCRPLRVSDQRQGGRIPLPEAATHVRVAYLPPMSGLAANETRLDPGAVAVRIGEGRTAEVLRNLCYRIAAEQMDDGWKTLIERIRRQFGVTLEEPVYVAERGEISMTYRDLGGTRLDLSAAGRGLQQTLLLLAYLQANPGAVLLLDEPDAHLEILRQREIYQLVTTVAREQGSQVIAASHSEVVLREAAGRDIVIAFVGAPHRVADRGSQVLKALRDIPFDQYYQAEQKGWVLYVEGPTDLAILEAFAERLKHPAAAALERPFAHYVANQPTKAHDHFHGLREARPDLTGIALFDRISTDLVTAAGLEELMWRRREMENYLAFPEVLEAYAQASAETEAPGPLFAASEQGHRTTVMRQCIADLVPPIALRDRNDRWWIETKASDEFLDRLFEAYFDRLGLPNIMRKTDYHVLARLVPESLIDPEVRQKLDRIAAVAAAARLP
jgi:energy-coupling factor transporter ATP-binding protein EcfA2